MADVPSAHLLSPSLSSQTRFNYDAIISDAPLLNVQNIKCA